jgi:hypothetical protein
MKSISESIIGRRLSIDPHDPRFFAHIPGSLITICYGDDEFVDFIVMDKNHCHIRKARTQNWFDKSDYVLVSVLKYLDEPLKFEYIRLVEEILNNFPRITQTMRVVDSKYKFSSRKLESVKTVEDLYNIFKEYNLRIRQF